MNIQILIDGADVTDRAQLNETRINYDSSRRITTANVTVRWTSPGEGSLYDEARYDEDPYSFEIRDLALITILDGRDGVTKLFEGTLTALELKQTDHPFPDEVLYACTANDYAIWLDRAVTFDNWPIVFPCSDQQLIRDLVGQFCPRIHAGANVAQLIPALPGYDYGNKTCRQLLDDMCALSAGSWHVDFYGELFYGSVAEALAAPYDLSTDPDFVSSFPVRVDTWRRDFSNPVNTCYVRGALDQTGVYAQATYIDPVSVQQYGPLQYSIIDTQITDTTMAELRAKTTVLQYSQPQEQGAFTVWTDGLALGQKVNITEGSLAIDGQFVIRSLALAWLDQEQVQYTANFGALQPDLESYLRLLDQRTRWQTSAVQAGKPIDGSVSDASIIEGGLSGVSIGTINASQITGLIQANQINTVTAVQITGAITAGQIGSVNAAAIQGSIVAGQIGSVNAPAIQGSIVAGQIGGVYANTIQGVIISSQVADGIIDALSKFATQLTPIQTIPTHPASLPDKNFPPNSYFYSVSDAVFYQMNAAGTSYTSAGSDPAALTGAMQFYNIGRMNVKSLIGLILAAQIQSITAGQITGQIQAAQINTITAGQITGTISAGQIGAVNASTIQGQLTASQISTVNATSIQGSIVATQIGTINAATITIGQIVDGQIANINGSKLTVGTVNSDKLNATSIDCGGGGGKPGVINTYDGAGTVVARMGLLTTSDYGIWAKVFGAGGTSYADAVLKTDTAGNLTITNAYLDIEHTATNTYVRTGPTTFDSTYGSIAVRVASNPTVPQPTIDDARLVSRGLVCYYGTSIVAAIVRSPTTPTAGAVQLQTGILLDGANGSIQGKVFQCSVDARMGISGTFNDQDGSGFIISGGIVTGRNNPTFTPISKQLNIAAYPSGWYECYFTNGYLVSVITH